jgi:hypothetical protein
MWPELATIMSGLGRGSRRARLHPCRRPRRDDARSVIDGAEEIVQAATRTSAQMHYCHINSTSQRHIDRVLTLVVRAQAAGSRVTTKACP